MQRHEFERAVGEAGLDPASNHLLRYLASKKHWNDEGQVWPSAATTVRETGLSASTVKRRMPLLRRLGWIVDTGQRVGNGAIVYDLAIGNQCHTDTSTSVTQTPTSVTETPTSVTVTHKEVKKKLKEEVIEEVTAADAATFSVREESRVTILPNPEGHGTWHKPKRRSVDEEIDEIFDRPWTEPTTDGREARVS